MRFIRITNKQKYHNMPSGAILHKHRTKREDSSRWHIMIHPSIVAVLLIGIIYTIIIYTCYNVNASNSVSFTVDNSDTVLELTLPSSITLDLVPSSTNNYVSFGTSDLSILAGTNNPYGLTLTMSVPNTNLTNSSLTITNDNTNNPNNIPLDSSNHPIIPTLSSGTTYTESTFTTNSWGYKLSTNTNYSSVPSSLELLNTDSASNAITTTLNLAAKVDSTRPAGVYSAVLSFSLVSKVLRNYTPYELMQLVSAAGVTANESHSGTTTSFYLTQDYTLPGNIDGDGEDLMIDCASNALHLDNHSFFNFNSLTLKDCYYSTADNLVISDSDTVALSSVGPTNLSADDIQTLNLLNSTISSCIGTISATNINVTNSGVSNCAISGYLGLIAGASFDHCTITGDGLESQASFDGGNILNTTITNNGLVTIKGGSGFVIDSTITGNNTVIVRGGTYLCPVEDSFPNNTNFSIDSDYEVRTVTYGGQELCRVVKKVNTNYDLNDEVLP